MADLKMAVIGKDVSGSLSPVMHNFIMKKLGHDVEYDKVSIDPDNFEKEFPKVFAEYDTLNVTIPYKLDVIPYMNELKEDAIVMKSVNTIDCRTKFGYNTDGVGFMLMIENAGVTANGKTVLVLGTGGVGRTVIKKLVTSGATVSAFDLNQDGLKELHEDFPKFTPLTTIENKHYDIIINCTGVGMHKSVGKSPVSENLLKLCDAAVDLIYVPAESEFLRLARINGKKTVNGEAMLFYQAYYADCLFLGRKSSNVEAKNLFEEYRNL